MNDTDYTLKRDEALSLYILRVQYSQKFPNFASKSSYFRILKTRFFHLGHAIHRSYNQAETSCEKGRLKNTKTRMKRIYTISIRIIRVICVKATANFSSRTSREKGEKAIVFSLFRNHPSPADRFLASLSRYKNHHIIEVS